MDHVAIMNKKWGLIPKILSSEKTIESRWYKNKIAPWNKIHEGDFVYFKDTGELITARATVGDVIQYSNLTPDIIKEIVMKFGREICLQDTNFDEWRNSKKYCILIFLKGPQPVQPFCIDKSGFGNAAAWLVVPNIEKIRINDYL